VLVTYLSIVVALPIAALVSHGLGVSVHTNGAGLALWNWDLSVRLGTFWDAVTAPAALSAIWLSLWLSAVVAAVNAAMGVAIAWVLVRDRFVGQRLVEGIIDLPFALPTIVAGVVLLFLYGDASPLHVNLFETWMGLLVALLFVTLPFSVRAVQPVLASLEEEAEAAARSLGAGRLRAFASVVLPSLWPAVLSGFALGFARAIGEFGSISLISGGLQRTTPASAYVYNLTQSFQWINAAAVSTVLLALSLVVMGSTGALSRRLQRRLSS
jgi:sulfate transport system permease protein